jgi:hypothetical protein
MGMIVVPQNGFAYYTLATHLMYAKTQIKILNKHTATDWRVLPYIRKTLGSLWLYF